MNQDPNQNLNNNTNTLNQAPEQPAMLNQYTQPAQAMQDSAVIPKELPPVNKVPLIPKWVIWTIALTISTTIIGGGAWLGFNYFSKNRINNIGSNNMEEVPQIETEESKVAPQTNRLIVPSKLKGRIVESGPVPTGLDELIAAITVGGERVQVLNSKIISLSDLEKYYVEYDGESFSFQKGLDEVAKYDGLRDTDKYYLLYWEHSIVGDMSKKIYPVIFFGFQRKNGEWGTAYMADAYLK